MVIHSPFVFYAFTWAHLAWHTYVLCSLLLSTLTTSPCPSRRLGQDRLLQTNESDRWSRGTCNSDKNPPNRTRYCLKLIHADFYGRSITMEGTWQSRVSAPKNVGKPGERRRRSRPRLWWPTAAAEQQEQTAATRRIERYGREQGE